MFSLTCWRIVSCFCPFCIPCEFYSYSFLYFVFHYISGNVFAVLSVHCIVFARSVLLASFVYAVFSVLYFFPFWAEFSLFCRRFVFLPVLYSLRVLLIYFSLLYFIPFWAMFLLFCRRIVSCVFAHSVFLAILYAVGPFLSSLDLRVLFLWFFLSVFGVMAAVPLSSWRTLIPLLSWSALCRLLLRSLTLCGFVFAKRWFCNMTLPLGWEVSAYG